MLGRIRIFLLEFGKVAVYVPVFFIDSESISVDLGAFASLGAALKLLRTLKTTKLMVGTPSRSGEWKLFLDGANGDSSEHRI